MPGLGGPWVADKARMLGWLINKIRRLGPGAGRDCIETFNALTIPRGYIYIDPDDMIHVVMLQQGAMGEPLKLLDFGVFVAHEADFVWCFDPATGMWNVLKDRTGAFESLCPIKCGGIPAKNPGV